MISETQAGFTQIKGRGFELSGYCRVASSTFWQKDSVSPRKKDKDFLLFVFVQIVSLCLRDVLTNDS